MGPLAISAPPISLPGSVACRQRMVAWLLPLYGCSSSHQDKDVMSLERAKEWLRLALKYI